MCFPYERGKADKKHKANETGTKEKKKGKESFIETFWMSKICVWTSNYHSH